MLEEVQEERMTQFDEWRGFKEKQLSDSWYEKLTEKARAARGNILKMTTLAASGHPGGSMSSIEMYLLLYHMANVDPRDPQRDDRDRIIISHGHTSPGAYTALASAGFFDIDDAIAGFRQAGSPFEGHVERSVPGIEWGTGNLGQGLSVGIGKALYARLSGKEFRTYVMMGDGEQQKGQIAESRRIAIKYKLSSITVLIDYNRLQISGRIDDILPQHIVDEWKSSGWHVLEVDGHDLRQLYEALYTAHIHDSAPTMILAHTTMGKGVSFMENKEAYHGAAIKEDKLGDALEELGGLGNDLDRYKQIRKQGPPSGYSRPEPRYPDVDPGQAVTYPADKQMDNRSAFGNALLSVADANMGREGFVMGVFDCDLAGSVKTEGFANKYPDNFFQFGITEHSTATASGSLSAEKALSVWADFGVFGIVETYNQARLNAINHANLKLFCTHCGLNVGEDGMTHQCIDYFALLNSAFGWKVITPADPNQTDRVVRYVLSTPGNFAVIMGRAKNPVITDMDGNPYFGGDYHYRYGRIEQIRTGGRVALVSSGHMLWVAMDAWKLLKDEHSEISVYCVSDWSDFHSDDLRKLAAYDNVVTLEDHNIRTGLGTTIIDALAAESHYPRVTKMGVTQFGSSGKPNDLYKLLDIDASAVVRVIKNMI